MRLNVGLETTRLSHKENEVPIYEYRCSKCGTDFELMRSISGMNEPASCPKCGAEAERLVSVFASKVDFYLKVPTKPAFRKPPKED